MFPAVYRASEQSRTLQKRPCPITQSPGSLRNGPPGGGIAIKKLLFLTPVLFCLLALGSCDLSGPQGSSAVVAADDDGPVRQFWAKDTEDNFYRLDALELVTGAHCIFYVEKANSDKAPRSDVESLAGEFDTKIFPVVTENFGNFLDVDNNGKVIFLLLDIQDTPGMGYTAGYFYTGDMYDTSIREYSNMADMLYIDINPGKVSNQSLRYHLAHEFQHLVNFSVRQSIGSPQDTWINEGLSTAAEYLYGGKHLQDRIDFFNDPRTSIPYGNNFYYWNDGFFYGDSGLANYATVYLFFQWLRIHAGNGQKIYKEIINSEYGDYRAVTGAASRHFDPPVADDWELLLRTWLAANGLNEESGLNGYKGELETKVFDIPPERPYFIKQAENPFPLFPGEAVYSTVTRDNSYTNTGNIRYAGLKNRNPIDTDGTYSGGWKLLTYNVNTTISPMKIESGQLGDNAASAAIRGLSFTPNRSVSVPDRPLPAIYDWDPAAALPGRHDWFGAINRP
jgi:hypothetical protein